MNQLERGSSKCFRIGTNILLWNQKEDRLLLGVWTRKPLQRLRHLSCALMYRVHKMKTKRMETYSMRLSSRHLLRSWKVAGDSQKMI